MEIDGFHRTLFENSFHSRTFKDEFDEELFYLLASNLPTSSIIANNSFILQRMNIIFSEIKQSLLLREDIKLNSIHVFGSQSNGLALKDSDIDLTILTQEGKINSIGPKIYTAFQKIPESKFEKLGFRQRFNFNMFYHPVMRSHLIQVSNIQTTKFPTHYQSIDLMINGYDGVRNSLAIRHLVETSKTYRYLVLSLKLWLSQFRRKRRMPLYSYYIMAAFYLQKIARPTALPKVNLRPFKEESFKNLIETQSQMACFDNMDLVEQEGFTGLSNLLKGFFKYYGVEYHQENRKSIIFVQQPVKRLNHPLFINNEGLKYHILDPLSNKPISDLKIFENKTHQHVKDLKKAFQQLRAHENIFPETSTKKVKSNHLGNTKISFQDMEGEKKIMNEASTEDSTDEFEFKSEEDNIPRDKKRRITYRIDHILEKRLLFQKRVQEKKDSSDSANRKSLSELQYLLRRRNASTQIYRHGVQNIFRILNVLPK